MPNKIAIFLLVATLTALAGCGTEECAVSTADVEFVPNPNAPGLFQADVVTDRCGGDGTDSWRLEVECVGDCPEFTARVFQSNSLLAEAPVDPIAGVAVVERYASMSFDVNEFRLYVEAREAVSQNVKFVGHFTGSMAIPADL